jgi:hypothetical protein
MYMLKQWVRRMPVNDVPGWRKLSGHNGNSFKSCVWEGERNLMARKGTREVETVKEFDKNFLTYKGQRWPRDTLKFIVEEVGVPRDKISGVAEASQVMYMNISNIQPKLDFFMSDLYIPRKTLGRVIGAFPQLLTLSLQSNLIPKLRYLSDEIGLEDDAVGRIVMRYPQLLGLSLEHNIQPTIAFLLHEALVPDARLASLVKRYPSMLGLSLDANLRPTLAFLRDHVGVEPHSLGKAIGMNPMLLSMSLESTLPKTVAFYRKELGIPMETLAAMTARYPGLLTLNVDHNIKPKIELFVNGMGLSLNKATKLIAEHPSVLKRSRYSLWSTFKGLLAAGFSKDAARRLLASNPRLLLYGCRDSADEFVLALQADPIALTAASARALVTRCPSLLAVRAGTDRMRELAVFLGANGITGAKFARVVEMNPQILALSVEKRLKVRSDTRLPHRRGRVSDEGARRCGVTLKGWH